MVSISQRQGHFEPDIPLSGRMLPDLTRTLETAARSPAQEPVARKPIEGVVAVVGCDGTGKTTLVRDLVAALRRKGSARRYYMGLISGETGDRIKELPFIGPRLEAYLAAKARRAQDMKKKVPGVFTAIVMYLFSIWRVFQLKRLMRLARGGERIIADRWPQAEIPGFHYDGPGLAVERTNNWLVRKFAAREQKLYEWMAGYRPALIIRLNIDADTAHARKADHPLAELREKVAAMPRIGYNGAKLYEIDAREPYPEVFGTAMHAVDGAMPR